MTRNLKVKCVFPWWLNLYLKVLVSMCIFFKTEPDYGKLKKLLRKHVKVIVND